MNTYEVFDLREAKYFCIQAISPEEACKELNVEFYKCFIKEIMPDGKIRCYDPQDGEFDILGRAVEKFKKVLMKELIEPICRPFLNFLLWLTKKINQRRHKWIK
jgi:hypothetical protein